MPTHEPEQRRRLSPVPARAAPPASSRPFPRPHLSPQLPSSSTSLYPVLACTAFSGHAAARPVSVAPVPLLLPGVAMVVVAVGLPEAGLIVVAQLEAADPLRALQEVQMRDEQARRAAMLGLERLAAVLVGDPRPS